LALMGEWLSDAVFISSLNVIGVGLIKLESKQYRIVPHSLHAAALRTRRCNAEEL